LSFTFRQRSILWLALAAVILPGGHAAVTQATSAHASDPAEITLTGSIDDTKAGQHELRTFHMPPGIQRMDVTLDSPGFAKGMYVTLGLFDPQRYRGEGRASLSISTVTATGPYMPGPLVPGQWTVALGYNYVAPGSHGVYTVHIHLYRALDPPKYVVLKREPGWYQGDLHSHTGYTDAMCNSQTGKNVPCPPFKLLLAAAQQKLDFLAVTDHNTQATFNELEHDQAYFDKLLILPGEEITTVKGHANVWGTLGFLDYRVAETGFTVNGLFAQAHALGALVSINHAYWPYDGRCPGCGWGWASITDFSHVDAIEVINGFRERGSWFTPPPGNGIPLWEAQLAKGLRPTGVGGGDDHRGGERLAEHDGVGIPTTVVYARELSQPALLEAIKAGHVYVKTTGPSGPELLLTSGAAMMGDELVAEKGKQLLFAIHTSDHSDARLRVLVDGQAAAEQPPLADGASGRDATFRWTSDGNRHWVRVELMNSTADPLVLTNPIYINWR
jgi:hypothetical protein